MQIVQYIKSENKLYCLTFVKIFSFSTLPFCRSTVNRLVKYSITMTGHFFEGAEKLLEIWFATSSTDSGKAAVRNDLRNIPR